MPAPLTATSFREDFREAILPCLAPALRGPCGDILGGSVDGLEELRIRCGRPLMGVAGAGDFFIDSKGRICHSPGEAYTPSRDDMDRTVQILAQGSAYALEEQLRQGFLTLPGGHRAGLAGRALLEGGRMLRLTDISGLNIRLARAIPGLADPVLPLIIERARVLHTLIVSPPRGGKTTLLRDVVRQVSAGVPSLGLAGQKVGLVDERSEVAACLHGIPQVDVGPRTDVLDACPKADGIIMLIRSMSPQVVATDELGGQRDVDAVEDLINAGATLIATAHGRTVDDLRARPGLARLLEWKVLQRFVFLGRSLGVGTLERVTDGHLRDITSQPTIARPQARRALDASHWSHSGDRCLNATGRPGGQQLP